MRLREALRHHWPEYGMEAAGLGGFMVSAVVVTTLMEHPASPLRQLIEDATLRRILIGMAMGLTAVGLIYSPWGKQSGAHLNPAVTLTFLRLDKIAPWDAAGYATAQFVGGIFGVTLASLALGHQLEDPAVNFAVTTPGMAGIAVAFLAEAVISFGLMYTVLSVSNHATLARLTGFCAAALVATYIAIEAPLSGMSMNPARSLASAVPAQIFTALWIYFTAPPLGMLLAAEIYVRRAGNGRLACPKLHHANSRRCIFCGKPPETGPSEPSQSGPFNDSRSSVPSEPPK